MSYISFDDYCLLSPKDVHAFLYDLKSKINSASSIKVVHNDFFSKTKMTIIKASKETIYDLSKYLNLHISKDKSEKHIFFKINVNDYKFKFISTNLKRDNNNYQEIGVLIYLDNDLKNLDVYKSRKLVGINPALINSTIKFLKSNKDWDLSCKQTARIISKSFINYKNYELHRNSNIVKKIRKLGSLLSGLNADKWNPSDIYLIKDSDTLEEQLKNINNIESLNNYINNSKQIIGISLKKSYINSMHGSIALSTIVKHCKLNFERKFMSFEKIIHELYYNDISKFIYINLKKMSSFTISKNIELMKISNNSYFNKYFIQQLCFLLYICKNLDHAHNILKSIFCLASSRHNNSCMFYEAGGGDNVNDNGFIKRINNNPFSFSLKKIIIPFNNESTIILDCNVNNKLIKMQFRSKGSNPQFIILNPYVSNRVVKMINIKDLNL